MRFARFLGALGVVALVTVALSARSSGATSLECRTMQVNVGKTFEIAGQAITTEAGYRPLIEQAAKGGLDQSEAQIKVVADKEHAIDAKITALARRFGSIKGDVLSSLEACMG